MKIIGIIDAFARAFGMFVFAVIMLRLLHGAFPKNWLALVALYFLLVPLAAVYGLLVGPQFGPEHAPRRFRVPGLLIIGIAAAA